MGSFYSVIHKATASTGTISVEQENFLKPRMGEQPVNAVPVSGRRCPGFVNSAICSVLAKTFYLLSAVNRTSLVLAKILDAFYDLYS